MPFGSNLRIIKAVFIFDKEIHDKTNSAGHSGFGLTKAIALLFLLVAAVVPLAIYSQPVAHGFTTPNGNVTNTIKMALTPFGLAPAADAHGVPSGSTVLSGGEVILPNGTAVIIASPIPFTRVSYWFPNGTVVLSNGTAISYRAKLSNAPFIVLSNGTLVFQNGTEMTPAVLSVKNCDAAIGYDAGGIRYTSTGEFQPFQYPGFNAVEYADLEHSTVNSFSGSWVAPSSPSSDNGQLIYIFIATEDLYHSIILQPVLQWGDSPAGGGPYWEMASWAVSGLGTYYSTPIGVIQGNSLEGNVQLNLCLQGGCTWSVMSTDSATGASTTLKAEATQQYFAYVTLEAYGIASCSDYPPSGATQFTNLAINGGGVIPSWSTWVNGSETPQCGYYVSAGSSSTVTLGY